MKSYSGCGNTFSCIDNRKKQPLPTFTTDGLLLLEESVKADFRMRILNPDLSEAEMCGNGLRCFKLFLYDLGYTKPTYTIETLFTTHTVTSDGNIVTASMGTPKILSQDPLIIDTGVPHILTFVDDIKTAPVNTLGPVLRQKHNANATFIQKNDPLLIRTYERGVEAETLACGTAACAAAYATKTQTVRTPSGEHLTITVKRELPSIYVCGREGLGCNILDRDEANSLCTIGEEQSEIGRQDPTDPQTYIDGNSGLEEDVLYMRGPVTRTSPQEHQDALPTS